MITIGPATPSDVDAVVDLLADLARFYRVMSPEDPEQSFANVRSALFAEPPSGYALLAWDGDLLVGMAAYSFQWPARGTARLLFLKELYVREGHRGSGAGRELMAEIFATAKHAGAFRVEWQTDADNTRAQRFYESIGAQGRAKVFYRVEADDFASLKVDVN